MGEVVEVVVVIFVMVSLACGVWLLCRYSDIQQNYVATVRAIRWWMWLVALVHILVVFGAVVILMTTVPALAYGWWKMLGGEGNVMLGQTGWGGTVWQAVAVVVPVVVLTQIPHLAYVEERLFRHASELDPPWTRTRRLVIFGLAHPVLAGVPIAVGIVLIGSGLLFDITYRSEMRRLMSTADLVHVDSEPPRAQRPPVPVGPYDPAAWYAYRVRSESVREENKRSVEQWIVVRREQEDRREAQIDELRDDVCATAAALHTCSNWLIVAVLVVWTIFG